MHDIENKKNKLFQKIIHSHAKWNIYEKLIFFINLVVTIGLLIYSAINNAKDWTIWVAFIGNFCNILSVILATKKRVICFFWGILAVGAFGAIALYSKAFGNMILYWAFYIPAQIVAWVLWYKSSSNKIEIAPIKTKWYHNFAIITISILLIALFTLIETQSSFQKFWFGSTNSNYILLRFILDASILVLSLAMTVYAWLRFRERWVLSIVIDSIQTIFWIMLALGIDQSPHGKHINADWIMVASSLTMLVAAIYGTYNWWKGTKK